MGDEGLVIVGVDGSNSARTALQFALEEAERRGARVRAVIAFQPLEYWPVTPGEFGAVIPPSPATLAEDAERTVRRAVTEASAAAGSAIRDIAVEVSVAPGKPGAGRCSTRPPTPTCSSWATGASAPSPARAWGRSGCSASCTRPAR